MIHVPSPRTRGYLLLAGIIILAGALRFAALDAAPAGLYPDEAVNGADTLHVLATGEPQLFYQNNFGREGLFINLQAVSVALFGNTMFALRAVAALFGTIAVFAVYLLGKEMFHRTSAGLLAAFFLAVSYWGINFSRIGFRASMVTALIAFAFYFFFRGLRTQRILPFFLAGIFVGLGAHTYIAFRAVPLIFLLLLPILLLSYERFLQRFYKHALVFIAGAALAAAPLVYHFFISHPEDLTSRSSAISVFTPAVNQDDLPGTIAKTLSLSLVKYTFFGDQNYRHNYAPYPVLDPFTSALFLAGFLYVCFRFLRLLYRRLRYTDRDFRLIIDGFLLSSFFVMLTPEFLTAEGLPHALRSIGTQAPVFLIAALPLIPLLKRSAKGGAGLKIALGSFLILIIAGTAVWNTTRYFYFFAGNPKARASFDESYTNMARFLLALPESDIPKYVINMNGPEVDNGLAISAQPIYFLTYGKVTGLRFVRSSEDIQTPGVIILQRPDSGASEKLLQRFPTLAEHSIDMNGSRPGGEFSTLLPASNR